MFAVYHFTKVEGTIDYTNFYVRLGTGFWFEVLNRHKVAYYSVNTYQPNKCMTKSVKRTIGNDVKYV